ncbi:MAG: VCBS repeat-containing protein [Sphingobacteriales bacterium]|nr:VCBS repeat-containing protein [Sphingobacteriales bacterium]
MELLSETCNNRDLDFVGSIYTADLNNDGNTDILWIVENTIAWIPNNGDGTFGNYQVISDQAAYAQKALAVDVDNDGDIDVVSASKYSTLDLFLSANKIVWFSNNGNGTFAPEEVITTNVNYATSIATADLDNDGDLDLASASDSDNKVAWYENLLSYLPPPATTPPTASFNTYPTTTDTLSICQGQTVYFNNTSQNATNYNWSFGDGTQSNDSNPAHTFNTSGNYEVELVAYKATTDNTACLIAVDDYAATNTNVAINLYLLSNDSSCSENIAITGIADPENGSISINEGVEIIYSPNSNFVGEDCFNYTISNGIINATATVCVTVTQACVIANDDAVTIPFNTGYSTLINVINNDSYCMGFGNVTILPLVDGFNYGIFGIFNFYDGIIWYSVTANYVGQTGPVVDCFKYVINTPYGTDTAQVCVTITGSCIVSAEDQNLSLDINNAPLTININVPQLSCYELFPSLTLNQPANGIVEPIDEG